MSWASYLTTVFKSHVFLLSNESHCFENTGLFFSDPYEIVNLSSVRIGFFISVLSVLTHGPRLGNGHHPLSERCNCFCHCQCHIVLVKA